MVSSLVRVNKEFMNEFEQRFFERLSNDELLDKLVVENEVDLENVLSTYVDDTWGYHSIRVSHELLKHFLKDDVVNIMSIRMILTNYTEKEFLGVDCEVQFSYKVRFPNVITIGDDVEFKYKDEFGRTCGNVITNGVNTRRMESTFKLFTVNELVDVLFEILGQLLKEENK
jgi:hypothetical protein